MSGFSSQPVSPVSPLVSPVATRGRSKSESASELLKGALSLKLKDNKRSISPLAKPDSPTSDPSQEKEAKAPRSVLTKCPCGKSSGGQSWVLKCTSCTQSWHNVCANLKGNLPRSTIDALDLWQCPWCYLCPLRPPKSHKSQKTATSLQSTVISDAILTQVEDTVKFAVSNCGIPDFKNIESQLKTLTEAVQSFSKGSPASPQTQAPHEPPEKVLVESIPHSSAGIDGQRCEPYTAYKENFVSEEQADEIKSFLDNEEFRTEGKRGVVSYGEKYKYMGSRSLHPKPIPNVLKPLMDSLNKDLNYSLNQILVNKYTGEDACLPSHSDDERDINPSSNIFTVSIGDSATVSFCSIADGEKKDLNVAHRSLYAMSRDSQNVFRHGILANPSNTIRYSLTFRCVHWTYLNSMYAVGDSNFGRIKFGEGKGCVGKSTPGLKDFAPKVESIDPSKCMSHSNIVVMCGTNNLKQNDVDVLKTYQVYKGKFEEIRRLNPKCSIFVCPVLPSRKLEINQRIVQFNKLIFDDLMHSNLDLKVVNGFGAFVDNGGVLRSALHDKRTSEDVLHINESGYRILVRSIKSAIFSAKKARNNSNTGRLYSNITQGPTLNFT